MSEIGRTWRAKSKFVVCWEISSPGVGRFLDVMDRVTVVDPWRRQLYGDWRIVMEDRWIL